MFKLLIIFLIAFFNTICFASQSNHDSKIKSLEQSVQELSAQIDSIKKRQIDKELQWKKLRSEIAAHREYTLFPQFQTQFPSLFEKDYTRMTREKESDILVLTSDEGENAIAFHGLIQSDANNLFNSYGLNINDAVRSEIIYNQNTVTRYWFNRLSPMFEIKLKDYINMLFIPDFGKEQQRLFDGVVDLNYYRFFGLQIGYQKSIVSGLENLQDEGYWFVTYQSFPSTMAPNREVGIVLHGTLGAYTENAYDFYNYFGFYDAFAYEVGILNGTPDGDNPGLNPVSFQTENQNYIPDPLTLANKSFEGRVFMNPFMGNEKSVLKNLGFGISSSTQTAHFQGHLPDMLSLAQNPIFSYNQVYAVGNRQRYHPQIIWYLNQIAVLADWNQTIQHLTNTDLSEASKVRMRNKATQIQLVYNLTGEPYSILKMTPNTNFHPFDLNSLGAWQLMFRFSTLNMDTSVFNDSYIENNQRYYVFADPRLSVSQAKGWTVGLLWYWSENFRISTEYEQTLFKGGCSTGAMEDPEHPGCFSALPIYYRNVNSEVTNRPTEKVFMQRFQIYF